MRYFILKFFKMLFKFPYSSKLYMFLLTGIINKYHIGKGLKSKTFIPQGGFYLNLRLDDWLQQQIYFLGSYENYELQVLKSKLNQGSIMIDIGANIGLYSFFSASIVGKAGKVISFEPYSLNFNIFKENLALNKFENIILNRFALADKNDVIELFYNSKELNLGMVSAFEKNFEEFETVNCTTLDYYLMDKNLTKIDFIKMDIEGGEYLALLGMNETIKNSDLLFKLKLMKILLRKPHT